MYRVRESVHAMEATMAANAALSERAAAAKRCARCESRHYKQRKIWSGSFPGAAS
jgi:hypothetical protein